jgi:ATPase subunit of ABC transporter with duplicated ATPase domains
MRLGELEGVVAENDGYTAESDAAILLDGLDIPEALHERKMSELQGGQKVRVLLAQALFGSPAALLLDEPTNHLDLESIHWLQDFLNRYQGTLIVISHDRHFLNSVTTHTADIDYQTIITYTGGYDDMVLAKTQIRSRLESQNAQREKKIEQLNEFIARFSAGTRSSQVMSRKKEVERLQTSDLARSNIARPFIRFRNEAAFGASRSRSKRTFEILRRSEGGGQLHGQHFARRESRDSGTQRGGKDHADAVADCERPAPTTPFPVDGGSSNGAMRLQSAILRRIIATPFLRASR